MIVSAIGAFIASVGFGIVFHIDERHLLKAGLCGIIGGFVYELAHLAAFSEFVALFLAAVCVSITSEILARKVHTPVTTFLICGIIPLVPGGPMYFTMLEVVRGNTAQGIEMALQTLGYAGAIAIAIIVVSSVVRLALSSRKG